MNPKAITFDSNEAVKAAIAINKKRIKENISPEMDYDKSNNNNYDANNNKHELVPYTSFNNQSNLDKEIGFLTYLETKYEYLRESNFTPNEALRTYSLDSIFLKESEFIGNIYGKYSKPKDWPIPMKYKYKCHPLRDDPKEIQRERDLVQISNKSRPLWLFKSVVMFIDMVKILPFFSRLTLKDQQILIRKVALPTIVSINAFYSYLSNEDVVCFPDGTKPIELHTNPVQLEIDIFGNSVKPMHRLKLNQIEFSLMKIIMICNESCTDVSPQAASIIKEEREYYCMILLKHLQIKLGQIEGAKKFGDILMSIQMFHHFAEKFKQLHVLFMVRGTGRWMNLPPSPAIQMIFDD
uniref:NR LBD domain-containing protein n=1 Tax=Rhabditophanes sp. KR3021 TaxID=114890 RepID=A0AC35TKY8_9BILA